MNATLQAWDAAVKAWRIWHATWPATDPRDATPEGQAYIDAMLHIPMNWRTPNAVAQGS